MHLGTTAFGIFWYETIKVQFFIYNNGNYIDKKIVENVFGRVNSTITECMVEA